MRNANANSSSAFEPDEPDATLESEAGDQKPLGQMVLDFGHNPEDLVPVTPYEVAAKQGDRQAQFQLAQLYRHGISGVARDLVEALFWYKAAEAQGHPDAAWSIGAVSSAMSDAELAEAECRIGLMLLESALTPAQPREAIEWLRRAAMRGHPVAQFEIGKLHEASDAVAAYVWHCVSVKRGHGPAKEGLKRARKRLRDNEFTRACLKLGDMYRSGADIPRDVNESLYWYRKAAEAGMPEAEFAIGEIHRNGEYLAVNDSQAFAWYIRAANRGHCEAQREVGEMYLSGEGTREDPIEGLAWLYVASRFGSEDAEVRSRDAERSLTQDEVRRAQRRSLERIERISGEGSSLPET